MHENNIVKVFATSGSEGLAQEICLSLRQRLPKEFQPQSLLTLSNYKLERFSNEGSLN